MKPLALLIVSELTMYLSMHSLVSSLSLFLSRSQVERAINPPLRFSLELQAPPEFINVYERIEGRERQEEGRDVDQGKYKVFDKIGSEDISPGLVATHTRIHSCELDEKYSPILTKLLLHLYEYVS